MEERKRNRNKMLSMHTPLILDSALTKEDQIPKKTPKSQ